MSWKAISNWVGGLAKSVGKLLSKPVETLIEEGDENVFDRSKDILAQSISQCFQNSQDPDGNPWAPPKNPSRKGKKLLVDTAFMMFSAIDAAREATIDAEGLHANMDTPVYAIFHQQGTTKLPQRKFFGVSRSALAEMQALIGKVVVKMFMNWGKVD